MNEQMKQDIDPINTKQDTEVLCNSFETGKSVAIGHDMGAAVWFQAVRIDHENKDKILEQDVTETGIEISVDQEFFRKYLRPLLIDEFDPHLPVNSKRFTHAFSNEGRYLNGFEEDCLECNFFTYRQMEKILHQMDDSDFAEIYKDQISESDLKALMEFGSHIRHIMEQNPNADFVSVMS